MKKLMLCCAALCFISGAFAQQLPSEDKTGTSINYNTDVQQNDDSGRTKSISKTFAADPADKITLSNQFGSMQLKVWDKREVKIDITITAFSSNDKGAEQLMQQVRIDAQKSGDVISCKTVIDQDGQQFFRSKSKRREVKVNYVVYLPAANSLTLSQQFGNVTMGDFSGPLSAKVQYGDFNAGNLSDDNNYINVQYGKTTIAGLNKGVIKQQYGSGLNIGNSGDLDLNAQYANVNINTIRGNAKIKQQYGSGLTIGSVDNLELDVQYANVVVKNIKGNATVKQQYNGLEIGSVGKLSLKSQYANVAIGTLRGDGNIRTSYNNLGVSSVTSGCKNLDIDADYVSINLGFAAGYNADFTLEKSYGGFKYGDNVKASLAGDNNSSTKNYSGKIGGGGAASLRIKSDYGSVSFK